MTDVGVRINNFTECLDLFFFFQQLSTKTIIIIKTLNIIIIVVVAFLRMAVNKNLLQRLCVYKRFDFFFSRHVNIYITLKIFYAIWVNWFDFLEEKTVLFSNGTISCRRDESQKARRVIVKKNTLTDAHILCMKCVHN